MLHMFCSGLATNYRILRFVPCTINIYYLPIWEKSIVIFLGKGAFSTWYRKAMSMRPL